MCGNTASKKKKTWITIVVIFAVAIIVAGAVFAAIKLTRDKQDDNTTQPSTTKTTPPPTQEEIDRSKELEEEIKSDFKDKTPEDFKPTITDKQTELDNAKQETENLKNAGASEEEIAKAEEKQKEIEKQLEEVKEEQAYWSVTARIKELYAKSLSNAEEYPNSYIRSIKDISNGTTFMVVDAEVVSKDAYGILRQHNLALKTFGVIPENFNSAQGLSKFFQECDGFEIGVEYNEISTELELDFFNNRIKARYGEDTILLGSKTIYDENGKLSKICVKYTFERTIADYRYFIFNIARMSKEHTNEEVAEMIKEGNIRTSILKGFITDHLSCYNWEKATIEYKGQEQAN